MQTLLELRRFTQRCDLVARIEDSLSFVSRPLDHEMLFKADA